ncbi:hypothetical protein ACXVUM_01715 [Williamsia sp. SKLECPSW1]
MSRTDAATLRPDTPVVHRGDRTVQIGGDAEAGLLVDLPPHLSPQAFVAFLRSLTTPRTTTEIRRDARAIGLAPSDVTELLQRMETAGVVTPTAATGDFGVRVHGRGPLSTRLTGLLRDSGVAVTTSTQRPRPQHDDDLPLAAWTEHLVVLCDALVHDPSIVTGLMTRRIPHLQVCLRGGVGVVGPLVLPGRTSCLRCADCHRADRDPQWPVVSGQMIGSIGHASAATTVATAGLALDQIEHVAEGLTRAARDPGDRSIPFPPTVEHTVEYRSRPSRLQMRRWTPHPLCGCCFRR